MPTEKKQKTVPVFCAGDQEETSHLLDIDANGEIVLTCSECERFLKFPAGTDAESLKEQLATHREVNEGQRSVEALEAEKEKLLEGLGE